MKCTRCPNEATVLNRENVALCMDCFHKEEAERKKKEAGACDETGSS